MSDHSTAPGHAAGDAAAAAFLADRQTFWNGFTHFTLWSVIFVIALLIAMAVFLL